MAGIVDVNEEERVERLLRMVRNTIEDRQDKIQAYDSLTDYNLKNPTSAFPAVVVVVDNVSEFKETYERFLPDLIALIRDGRSFGVYFVITASLTNDVPNKLFSLLSQRITFTLPDAGDYTTVVGRGWAALQRHARPRPGGADWWANRPVPLEFQTARPGGAATGTARRPATPSASWPSAWRRPGPTLEAATPALKARRPKPVEPLPKFVPLQSVLPALGQGDPNLPCRWASTTWTASRCGGLRGQGSALDRHRPARNRQVHHAALAGALPGAQLHARPGGDGTGGPVRHRPALLQLRRQRRQHPGQAAARAGHCIQRQGIGRGRQTPDGRI